VVPSTLPNYDPQVIEQFAAKLYRKASAFVAGSAIVGGAVGGAFGAVPLTSLGEAWPIPSIFGFATTLIGIGAGTLVGYVIGDTRSFGYRLQAQTALCQLQTERNTAAAASAVSVAVAVKAPAQGAKAPAHTAGASAQAARPPAQAARPPAQAPVLERVASDPPAPGVERVAPDLAPAAPPVTPPVSAPAHLG
jgi:hypothetical protein